MAVTFGFYNSVDGDRTYTAEQMGSLFDGILNDGIYQNVGRQFNVTPGAGLSVKVDTGRGWFNKTWILNDAPIQLNLAAADLLLNRIDAIVIEVNKDEKVRSNSIKVISGTRATSAERPNLTRSGSLFQYPLAYVYVESASTAVETKDITNARGMAPTNWVTGPLETMDASTIYSQWTDQWNSYFTATKQANDAMAKKWVNDSQAEFNTWFSTVKSQLDSNQAAYLAGEIVKLKTMLEGFEFDPTLYSMILDSEGRPVYDSSNTSIDGRIIYKKA